MKCYEVKYFLLFILVLNGCIPTMDLRHFTFYKKDPNNNFKIKTSGVYYYKKKYIIEKNSHESILCFILYNDGTFMDLHSSTVKNDVFSTIENTINYFKKKKVRYEDDIDNWGAYVISNDTLFIQKYAQGPAWEFKIYPDTALILNDTTLNFWNYFKDKNKKKPIRINEIYSFHPILEKPDSTNLFKKDNRITRKLNRLYLKRQKNHES